MIRNINLGWPSNQESIVTEFDALPCYHQSPDRTLPSFTQQQTPKQPVQYSQSFQRSASKPKTMKASIQIQTGNRMIQFDEPRGSFQTTKVALLPSKPPKAPKVLKAV